MNISLKDLLRGVAVIVGIEILSYLSFLYPFVSPFLFFLIAVAFLAIAFYKFEYGLYILLAEIFIGGKGYLFSIQMHDFDISIRMAFFIIIIFIWLIRGQRLFLQAKVIRRSFFVFLSILFIALLFGIIQYDWKKVYFDINGWFFLILIFIFYDTNSSINKKTITKTLLITTTYLSIKTITTFNLFNYDIFNNNTNFYKWIRNTGVGEITFISDNLHRIFFQSHIYLILGVFVIMAVLLYEKNFLQNEKNILRVIGYLSLFTLIISQSRSFWVAFILSFLIFIFYLIYKNPERKKQFSLTFLSIIVVIISQIYIIQITTGQNIVFSSRITNAYDEAAGKSRISQLTPLFASIKERPIFGWGFGKELTYKSSDPRVLQNNAEGYITTYAFEWGYLDIILKIGFVGLFVYLLFLFFVARDFIRNPSAFRIGLFFGFISLLIVHTFTPYLNHPLGIGFLLLMAGESKKLDFR